MVVSCLAIGEILVGVVKVGRGCAVLVVVVVVVARRGR